MKTELAIEKFVSLLQRSGIVPENHLEQLRVELADDATGLDSSDKIAGRLVEQDILTTWQADHLLRGKHRGFVLGPYRILKPLGKGGMGQVFLAEHQTMRRQCAIKVLPTKHTEDRDQMIERFHREAQAVAALDHKNIVRAYDVNHAMQGSTEIHYLVMEFIEGQDLQKFVEKHGTLDFGRAAHFIRQAAEGLEHAHRAGLVHRDVKPANLLVDPADVVKVLDLGLARFFNDDEQASLTDSGGKTVLGTADYLAPEQAMNSSDVDTRADIYSLGHTFYFLLMGHPPFPKGSIAQRLLAHQLKAPEPIENKRPDVPAGLLTIIEKMTAKQPEARYESAGKVAETLAAWLLDYAEDDELRRQAALTDSGILPPLPKRRESTRAAYDPGEETELALLPLDDERPRKTTPQPDPTPSDAAVDTEQEKVDAPHDCGPHEDLPDLGLSGADAMASLLDGEGLPGPGASGSDQSLSVLTLSSDSGPLTASGSRKLSASNSKESGIAILVRSPVTWVAGAGAMVVVGVIFLLAVSLSGTEPLASESTAAPLPQSVALESAPPTADLASENPPMGAEPAKDLADDPAASADSPVVEVVLPDAAPVNDPPSNVAQVVQRPPVASPPEEPATPVVVESTADRQQRLLAGAEYFSLKLASIDRDPRSKLNVMVRLLATQALDRAGLKPASDEPSPTVMQVSIETAKAGGLIGVIVAAQLVCHDPNAGDDDKSRVVVWERRKQLATVAPHLLGRDSIHTMMRPKVAEFFREFSDDCRAARGGE